MKITVETNHEDKEEDGESEEDGPKLSNRWSLVNLIDDNPYYEIVVKKSHSTYMTIPKRFAQSTGIVDMKKMRLVNEEGKEWEVEIVHGQRGIIIKKGWAEFRTHTKIACGDTCRYKLIRGHDVANVLRVQKIPTPRSFQYY